MVSAACLTKSCSIVLHHAGPAILLSGSLQMPAKTVPFPRSGPTRSTAHTTHVGQNAQESGAVVCLAPEPSELED